MKRLLVGWITTWMIFATANPAFAGEPFGFDVGKHPKTYGFCKKMKKNSYWWNCASAPRPHSAFETYLLQYVEGVGICIIKGIGATIQNDSYGTSLRSKIDELHGQLAKKYGTGEKNDFLKTGSIWDKANEWTIAIEKNERLYAYVWRTKDGFRPVENVIRLVVAAQAVSRSGYAAVEFHLASNTACEKKISEEEAKAF